MKRGFTLIELLVVITIIGILISLAVPNFIKAKDKALEAESKAILNSIRTQVERYSTDNDGLYPQYIFGGDIAGWTDGGGVGSVDALARDPLIWGGYLISYQRNAFMKDPRSLCQRTNDDPRFGCMTGILDPALGQIVGNILSDPNFPGADDGLCPTPATCTFGTESPGPPESPGAFPKVQYYFIGDDYVQTIDFIPGQFIYRSYGISPGIVRPLNITPGTLPTQFAMSVDHYILGIYGSIRTAGKDVLHCATNQIITFTQVICDPVVQANNRSRFRFDPLDNRAQCSPPAAFAPANLWIWEPRYGGMNQAGEILCELPNIAFVPAKGPVATSAEVSLPNPDGRADGIVLWFSAGTDEAVGG